MRIFSGIQPTGYLHLGNYLGALKNWVNLQSKAECLFCIVDLHALTIPQDPQALKISILETAAAYIAAGLDPYKNLIFPQSYVSTHAELAWVLSCYTPLGWLNRMTQFKDKTKKAPDNARLGLYAYPVLMAADILAYGTTHVPVGEDQKQHLELARDIAQAFNSNHDQEIFTLPEPLIKDTAARIMSLRDGHAKMSKSDPSDYSRINLKDPADVIALKIRKAKTDPEPLPEDATGLENRPEAHNLISIFSALAEQSIPQILKTYGGKTFSEFKKDLSELLIATLVPIGERIEALMKDSGELLKIMKTSGEQAHELSQHKLREVYKTLGLL